MLAFRGQSPREFRVPLGDTVAIWCLFLHPRAAKNCLTVSAGITSHANRAADGFFPQSLCIMGISAFVDYLGLLRRFRTTTSAGTWRSTIAPSSGARHAGIRVPSCVGPHTLIEQPRSFERPRSHFSRADIERQIFLSERAPALSRSRRCWLSTIPVLLPLRHSFRRHCHP